MNINLNNKFSVSTDNRGTKILKFFLAVLLAAAVLFCNIVPTAALDVKEDVKTVRVGFFHFDGYHNISEQGVRNGYGYQFLRLLSRYSNLNFEYVGYDKSWDDMQEMLENGEIDMLTSMHYTNERAEKFDFSTSIGYSTTIMTVRSNNTTIKAQNYADFDGMKVGLLKNSSRNDAFYAYAEEHGFQYNPVYLETQEDLTSALEFGAVDMIVSSNLRKLGKERVVEEFGASKFYAVVKKGNDELLSEINHGISQMDIHEGDWRTQLYHNNYDSQPLSEVLYSESEQAFLDAHKNSEEKLKVYFIPNSQPYCFIKDGKITGIVPDIVHKLMDDTGLNYEFTAAESPQDYKRIFEEGKADIVPAMVGTESYAETMGYLMTDAYLINRVSKVYKRNAKTTTGKIAVPVTSTYQHELPIGNNTLVQYPTARDAIKAVKSGEADAAYLEHYSCQWFINEDESNSLVSESLQDISYGMRIAVNQNLPHELCSILNKNILKLNDVEIQTIIQRHMVTPVQDLSFGEYIKANFEEFLLYAVIVVAVVLLLIVTLMLFHVRKVKRVNADLRQALDNYKLADHDRRTDFLTDLHSRQDMYEMFQDSHSGKREKISSLFMMDIDNFKQLNDRFGHKYGDECLKRIGAALNDYGAENDMIFYRYGGEELLGIDFSGEKDANQIAEELVQLVRDQRILRDDVPEGVATISLGYTTNNHDCEEMIEMADSAMYRAKQKGKNQAVCYETME